MALGAWQAISFSSSTLRSLPSLANYQSLMSRLLMLWFYRWFYRLLRSPFFGWASKRSDKQESQVTDIIYNYDKRMTYWLKVAKFLRHCSLSQAAFRSLSCWCCIYHCCSKLHFNRCCYLGAICSNILRFWTCVTTHCLACYCLRWCSLCLRHIDDEIVEKCSFFFLFGCYVSVSVVKLFFTDKAHVTLLLKEFVLV